MPVARKTVKAAKAVARRPAAARVADPDDVPEELQGFYGPPKLSRPRGGNTSAGYQPLALTTPTAAERRKAINRAEMEPLFTIDDYEYSIPVEFPPSLALVYLDAIDQGRDVAAGRVLKQAIGKTGWAALMNYVEAGGEIGMAAMNNMLSRVLMKVMGAVDEMGEGNG